MPHMSRSAVLTGYAALASAVGLDPYRMVRNAGLPLACLGDPNLKIPSAVIVGLLEASALQAEVSDFGLRLGTARELSNLGALGLLAREQSTVRQVVQALAENGWAQAEGIRIDLEDTDDLVIIHSSLTVKGIGYSRQAYEMLLATMTHFVSRFQHRGWRPEMVMMMHSAPERGSKHTVSYLKAFGSMPLFNQPVNAVVVRKFEMDQPIPGADPATADQLALYLKHVAGERRVSFVDTVRELIMVLLPRGLCTTQRIARHLGVDRRTVHRKLKAQGHTFETLLRDVRIELASAYLLAGERQKKDISDLLGFSSPSAFSRWCRQNLEP